MADLHINLSNLTFAGGDANFAQNLSRLERSGEHFNKEVGCFDHAVALGAFGDEFGIERKDGGRPVGGGIRVDETSADGALVAHLHIAEMACGFRQQRASAAQEIGDLNLKVGGHGADADLTALFLYIREIFDAAEIDEHFGLHEAQLHGGQQAVAAGQDFGVIFVLAQERDCVVEGLGGNVVKTCWDHNVSSYAAPAEFLRMICQTVSGLIGISMWRMPNGERASTTAETRAGVAPIVPASPTPFAPNGFTGEGVSVLSSSRCGIIAALGSA